METNPYSLVAFTECNVIITQSALVGEKGSSLWWKAGPWHFGGSLAMGGFSHHLCCHKSCRLVNELSSVPGPLGVFSVLSLLLPLVEGSPSRAQMEGMEVSLRSSAST